MTVQNTTKKLFLSLLLVLVVFTLFLKSKQSFAYVTYDCYHETGVIPALCYGPYGDFAPKFPGSYYLCDGRGHEKKVNETVSIQCRSEGYRETPQGVIFECSQEPPPVIGWTYEDVSNGVCRKETPETCTKDPRCITDCVNKRCQGRDKPSGRYCYNESLCCKRGSTAPCFDVGVCDSGSCPPTIPSYYDCNCIPGGFPDQYSGRTLFSGQCCHGGGGGGGGCTPQCPPNKCVVEDNCKEANQPFDPTEYNQYVMTEQGGPLCKGQDAYCIQENGCGGMNICNTKSCYKPETNISPADVTSIKIYERLGINNFEWTTYQPLSSTRRTVIRYPYKTSEIRTETNNPGIPSTARGLRVTLNGILRTLNVDNPFNSFINIPTTAPSLNPGNQGTLSSFFETLNKCDDNWVKGTTKSVNFVVNTPPTVISTTVTGNTTGNTSKGCTPEARYTGNEANRTLTFKIVGRDINTNLAAEQDDANHRINAAVLWLVKEGSTIDNERNTLTGIGSGTTLSNPNKIGIMVNTMGGIYKSHNGNGFEGWGRDVPQNSNIQQPYIYVNNNGKRTKIATITLESVKNAQNPTDTTDMTIKIEFEKNIPLSGRYQIWTGMMDNLTLFPTQPYGTFADIRSVSNTGQIWNFDFKNPRLTAITLDRLATGDQKNLQLKWTSTDKGHPNSQIVHTVVNVSSSSKKEVTRTLPIPVKAVIPGNLSADEMGNIGYDAQGNIVITSGWYHPTNSNGNSTNMIVNTGDTASGTLKFDVTLYDRACNFGGTGRQDQNPDPDEPPFPDDPDPFNYDRWMSTKGGIFYSQGTVDYRTKLLEPNIHFYNLGSELLATKANGIDPIREVLMFGGTEQHRNPAVAKGVEDTNEQNKVNLYEALKREANSSMDKKLSDKIISSATHWHCSSDKGCYIKSDKDLTIGSFRYTGKILIYSQGNITITGALQATSNNDAIFVFSEKNIIVNDGHATGGTDRIDAFLLAKERITIAQDAAVSENHDQVLLVGGLIAFGIGGESPSFVLQRNLGADNPLRPALIINYHPKYTKFAENFFDVDRSVYKKEVGFKPL